MTREAVMEELRELQWQQLRPEEVVAMLSSMENQLDRLRIWVRRHERLYAWSDVRWYLTRALQYLDQARRTLEEEGLSER